jgi:TMEM175 potassium channel family protein
MKLKKLSALVDAIFSFAMTLLVLTIEVPNISIHELSNQSLTQNILKLIPDFYAFSLSFFLLAMYWLVHNKSFKNIKKCDGGIIWINIVFLLFIVLVPFSTQLISEYGEFSIAAFVFNLNLFIIGSLLAIQVIYVIKNKLYIESLSSKDLNLWKKKVFLMPLFGSFAMIASFIIPSYSTLIYLLTPIAKKFMKKS